MLEFKDVLMTITPNNGEVDQELYGKLIRLVEVVEKTPIGKTLKITVWRKKSRVNLFITVGEMK